MSTGQEPVSGKLGRTEIGEPYDAGNMSGISPDQSNISRLTPHENVDTHHKEATSQTPLADPSKSVSKQNLYNDYSTTTSSDFNPSFTFASAGSAQGSKTDGRLAAESMTDSDISLLDTRNKNSSTASASDHAVFSSAGGVQGSKSDSVTTVGLKAPAAGIGESQGPPAKEVRLTKREIDEAAHVNTCHENPHTVGTDGKEINIKDISTADRLNMTNPANSSKGHAGSGKKGIFKEKLGELKHKVLPRH